MLKFLEHFAAIADALEQAGLWDEQDGFYYDVLQSPDGDAHGTEGQLDRRPDPAAADGRDGRAEIRRAAALRKAFARL